MKSKVLIKSSSTLLSIAYLFGFGLTSVYADPFIVSPSCPSPNPSGASACDPISKNLGLPVRDLGGPTGLLTILIQTAIIIASIGFFIYLIVGGLRWLTSGGDKMATQAARDSITNALIGLLIILATYGAIRILEFAFGLSIVTGGIKFPSP